jgi:hypothetical protein
MQSEDLNADPRASRSLGASAVGAAAIGALAVGAVAFGAVVIGRLAVRRARVRSLAIDELVVGRLRILDPGHPALPADESYGMEGPRNETGREPSRLGE